MKRLSLRTRNQTACANSFIRYAVSQAFTVLVVLWVNPDACNTETGSDDYVHEGAMARQYLKRLSKDDELMLDRFSMGDRTLILSDSSYIAGIVNPPEAKYGYWANEGSIEVGKTDDWFKATDPHEGSW